jgi:hypothetical protein
MEKAIRATLMAMAVAGLALVRGGPSACADGGDGDIYVRDKDEDAVVRELRGIAREYGTVLWVFDTATFNPPPGRNEFTVVHLYRDDLPKWRAAIASIAGPEKCPVYVATTLSKKVVPVAGEGWQASIERELSAAWWEAPSFSFEPAATWMERLVDQAGRPCMVVLVTGDILPEQTAKAPFDPLSMLPKGIGDLPLPDDLPEGVKSAVRAQLARPPTDESWRSKLAPVGAYWDEERVGAVLRERSSGLFVIAPEARFCDFLPVIEIPDVPWASRPQSYRSIAVFAPDRESIDRDLRPLIPDEEDRKRAVDRSIEKIRDLVAGTGVRFEVTTPTFCRPYGRGIFFNTDCPSGFGYWPFARSASATGGRYFFYPFEPSPWLDVCPRDPMLMSRLAPELVARSKYLQGKRGDIALDAICDACREVIEDTPWTDSAGPDLRKRAPGWMSFRSTNPLVLHEGFPVRDRPVDGTSPAAPDELTKWRKALPGVVKRYDRAIATLERVQKAVQKEGAVVHPRSLADLLLVRFWFEMSAFHLEALSIFLHEEYRLREPDQPDDLSIVTYVPTIKMSDCLEGYSPRSLSPDKEAKYERPFADVRGYQGNVLEILGTDPDFRAKRQTDEVLKYLDPRLKPRAVSMIQAAEAVMAGYARSPWGWMVYYTEAYTFVSKPVQSGEVAIDRSGARLIRPKTGREPPASEDGGPRTGEGDK